MSNIFFGLPISEATANFLLDIINQHYPDWQNNSALRWTALGNHHLTVHFFGLMELELLSGLINDIDKYIKHIHQFSNLINKIDNFPKQKSDLIAAYPTLSLPLATLYQQVQQAVLDHQLPGEQRPYLPHITLCRSRRKGGLNMSPIFTPNLSIDIAELILYQTQGSQYVPLHRWPLPQS